MHEDRLYEIQQYLNKHAADREPPYWFVEHPSHDEAEDYCWDCLSKGLSEDTPDYGGGYDIESDSPRFCESCDKPLTYIPTEYCVTQELFHFEEYGIDLSSASQCYELARVAHNLYSDDQTQRFIALFDGIAMEE